MKKSKAARRQRRKRTAQRTCVACRTVRPKRELVRIVRDPEGHVDVDASGKRNGRGAYLCPARPCWDKALSEGLLNRALRTNLTQDVRSQLEKYATDL
ncbi:MAG: YlxR family protein [Anaerolineae bacterium]